MKYLCALLGLVLTVSATFAGPLHDAARDGDLDRAKQLLDEGAVVAVHISGTSRDR